MTSSKPIPIAFCITDLDAGGAERALFQIVTRLDRQLWSPTVICLSAKGELVDQFESAGIEVHCLNAKAASSLWVIKKLSRLLKQLKPQLLQTFLFHANIAGRIAARFAKIPIVVSGIRVAEKRSSLYLKLDKWTAGNVSQHVCVSEDVKTFSIEQGCLPANQVSVIPNGVDFEHFQNAIPFDLSKFGIPEGSEVVVTVGRLDYQKGTLLLLDAIEEILNARAQCHLLCVGKGKLESELKSKVANLNLDSQVHLAGYHSDVAPFLKASTLFAFPSRWEGMPNAVLEAMATGLPVVTTAVEGIGDLITHDTNGLIVDIDDSNALKTNIELLLDSKQLQMDFAKKSQTIVKEEFTWDAVSKKYSDLYINLLNDVSK